ncbi:MAG: Formate hydrogenlyase transcriptional activator [Edaphobacter sp.]|nr:Formate hydrogenlyase transcriptional activator [Edaphobacter sp.]
MQESDGQTFQIIDAVPTLAWSARPDGSADFFNLRWLEYTGLSAEQALGWGWKVAIHPDDLAHMLKGFQDAVELGKPFEAEGRFRRNDGEFRWFLFRASPLHDESARVVRWYGTNTEIEDRKRTEDELRSNEESFRLLVDTIPGLVCTMSAGGEVELVNRRILDYFDMTLEELKRWGTNDAVHPDDRPNALASWIHSFETGEPYDVELRNRRADGVYRWHNTRALPQRDETGRIIRWSVLVTDIDERKKAEENLRRSEAYLAEAQKLSQTGSFGWAISSGEIYWSRETFRIFECDPTTKVTLEFILQRTHPEDRSAVQQLIERITREKQEFDYEQRLLLPDGSIKYLRVMGHPSRAPSGDFEFVGAVSDITESRRAGEALSRSEGYLADAQRVTRTGSWAWNLETKQNVHWSQEHYRIFGFDPAEGIPTDEMFIQRIHPEDRDMVVGAFDRALSRDGAEFEIDYRIVLPEGGTRYICSIGHPVFNSSGDVSEYIGTAMDVTEQRVAKAALEAAFEQIKTLKEQLYKENVALRDEVDRISMFEEVVGNSRALQAVLSRVIKVAPTDSTVLITGETGTGKELIARAIHKQSPRSQRAFVSVNCAALAPSLISSELFGHEKGAFTGAAQRRLGRFELADGGTIFLDEVGELPPDTQVALLRVLQEREFERVGGTRPIQVDVRVIAATNRNLEAAKANGTFRSDLYYRLNIFPIEVPPLRERRDDVLMLLEYFVHRFAKKAGKQFRQIDKRTLELFRSYDWPGNIRELQNVVERSVILSSDDVFCVDEAWLSSDAEQSSSRPPTSEEMSKDSNCERQIIEDALTKSRGRVAGPNGAAAQLRIHPSTLESKIRSLKISKDRFKLG